MRWSKPGSASISPEFPSKSERIPELIRSWLLTRDLKAKRMAGVPEAVAQQTKGGGLPQTLPKRTTRKGELSSVKAGGGPLPGVRTEL